MIRPTCLRNVLTRVLQVESVRREHDLLSLWFVMNTMRHEVGIFTTPGGNVRRLGARQVFDVRDVVQVIRRYKV